MINNCEKKWSSLKLAGVTTLKSPLDLFYIAPELYNVLYSMTDTEIDGMCNNIYLSWT